MISAGWLHVAWLSISSAGVGFAAPSTRSPQDIDKNLLNFIKFNLRRNNDDYDQLLDVDGNAPPPPAQSGSNASIVTPDATLVTATSAVPLTTFANLVVLVSASVNRPTPRATGPPPASDDPHAAKRALDDFDRNDIFGPNEKKRNTNTDESEEDDNRGLIQVFLKSKPVQPTPRQLKSSFTPSATTAVTTRTTPVPTPRSSTAPTWRPTPFPTRRPTSPSAHVTKTLMKNKPIQRKRIPSTKVKRPVPGEAVRVRESPRADILDMAPARGSRINAKRSKGRLCQRHVLLPEGPKYDSGGAVYLQPHDSHRPFPQTRAPRMLLPACCNCCKKSVLGCE